MSTEVKKAATILGVPLGYGASMAGVDIGPAALRVARLNQRLARLGYAVHDLGDMRLERPQTVPDDDDKLKFDGASAETLKEEFSKSRQSKNNG